MFPAHPSNIFNKVNTALSGREIKRHCLNRHYLDDQLQCTQLMIAAARGWHSSSREHPAKTGSTFAHDFELHMSDKCILRKHQYKENVCKSEK